MAEYIDRHALKNDGHVCWHDGKGNVFYEVDHAPIADVVEVVRGEWIQTTEPLGWNEVDCIECTHCHESWIMDEDFDIDCFVSGWKYCPNCGAKMDGKGDKNG